MERGGPSELGEIGRRIKEIREEKGLTQSKLAEIAHIARVSVGNYERGIRIPKADVMHSIAVALGVSVDDLLGRTREEIVRGANTEGNEISGRVSLTDAITSSETISSRLFGRIVDEIVEMHKARVIKDYSINMSNKGYSIHILNDSGSGAGLRGKIGGRYEDIGGFFDFLDELREEIEE